MGSVIIAIAIKHASINITDFLIGFITEYSNSIMLIYISLGMLLCPGDIFCYLIEIRASINRRSR